MLPSTPGRCRWSLVEMLGGISGGLSPALLTSPSYYTGAMKSTNRTRDDQGRYLPEPEEDVLVVRSIRLRSSTLALLQVQAEAAGIGVTTHLRQIAEAAAHQQS